MKSSYVLRTAGTLFCSAFVFLFGFTTPHIATEVGEKQRTKGEARINTTAKVSGPVDIFSSGITITSEPWKAPGPPVDKPEADGEFEGDAEARGDWFISQRTFPFTKIPADARRNAWASRPVRDPGLAPVVEPQWTPIGPRPTLSDFPNNWGVTSGRINSIAISPADPNIILVGAATGGVWRSTNGGANFEPASDSQVDLAVGSIAFAAANPSIVYAGMGDAASGYLGSGVLKSTDSGATWTRVSNFTLPSPGRISRIAVDPTDPNVVYVAQYSYLSGSATFSSGFFRSVDGGISWVKTISGLPRDLVQHPTDPNILYLAMTRADGGITPSTGGIWKSIDGGVSWSRIHTSPYSSTTNLKVAVTAAAPENLYVLSAGGTLAQIEISLNGGGTWTNRGSNFDTGQISYNCYLFVHPSDTNTIYVGTRDLWRSTNGGVAYTNITRNFSLTGGYSPTQSRSHPDQHHFYISPSDPNTFYLANDGGLSKTSDGGATFASLNASLGLTMFTSLDLHPTDQRITYGGTQDNGTQRRSAGSAWDEFISGDGGQVNIDPVDSSILFLTYVRHTIHRYVNNGNNYAATVGNSTIFNNDRIAFYPPFVNNQNDSNLYFGTYRLYVSTNRGSSWTAGAQDLTFGNGTLSAIGVGKSNGNTIYTGASDGRVMVSTDGGLIWTDRTAGLPQRFIKSIIVHPTDPNTAFVTVSGFGSGHVYKTVNGGAAWINISGNLPDIPVNTLLIDPRPGHADKLYVGTDVGIFRTSVGGLIWETFNNGMPPVIITELDGQPGGLIQAASYGRGAFEMNLNVEPATPFDYDGDRKADLSVYRPSDNIWHLLRGTAGYTSMGFGVAGDTMVPADYDGDAKTDIAMFRPSNGTWYFFNSATQSFSASGWGQDGDLPAPADHDGDGKADLVVFRSSTGTWFTKSSSNNALSSIGFGVSGDKPVVGDFDGDGRADIGVYRPSDNNWYVLRTTVGFSIHTWGQSGDIPVPADYDGDGKIDLAVFRPSTGQWFRNMSAAGIGVSSWGENLDNPVAADYDGDGKADIAVFRPSNGTWYIMGSRDGIIQSQFGSSGDLPTPKAFAY